MTPFEQLVKSITEESPQNLNTRGSEAVSKYHEIINGLSKCIQDYIKPYVKDPELVGKQAAIQVIATINSLEQGTEDFEAMARLDILTSGGKVPVDSAKYTFNPKDKVLSYLEKKV